MHVEKHLLIFESRVLEVLQASTAEVAGLHREKIISLQGNFSGHAEGNEGRGN